MIQSAFSVSNLPWLHEPYEKLSHQYISNRPLQGLIVTGIEGLGKKILVHELVQLILCLAPSGQKACLQCQSCLWMAQYHPDYLLIKPLEVGKAIRVEQIREITNYVHITSETGKKVICIEEAEQMNINAANSLLKNLEEPPENVFFILITEKPESLPITIRSRCQSYRLQTPSIEESTIWLNAQINASPPLIHSLLSMSFNAPLRALEYNNEAIFEIVTTIEQTLFECINSNASINKTAIVLTEHAPLSLNLIYGWLGEAIKAKSDPSIDISKSPKVIQAFMRYEIKLLMDQFSELSKIMATQQLQLRLDWRLEGWLLSFL